MSNDQAMRELANNLVASMLQSKPGDKNRFENAEVHIKREGTKITLPNEPYPMRYDEAIECLKRRIKEEETEIAVHEVIDAFPFDGAYAFMKALKEIYGWASPTPTPGFFGPRPPVTVNLEIDHGVFTPIIWGDFIIPGIEGVLSTGATQKDSKVVFKIGGTIKKKFQL